MQCEMQSVSSRIRTRVAVSNFTTYKSIVGYLMTNLIYIYIYISVILKHQTAQSKHFWSLKNKGLTPEIQWSILKKSNTPKCFDNRCNLCLEEKNTNNDIPRP